MDDHKKESWNPFDSKQSPLLYFAIIGILGILFFFWKYDDVFPAATLELSLNKPEIVSKAREIAGALKYPTEGCIVASTFGERSETATFLEREFSMREANALMQKKINVFFWFVRFCRQQQEEEFQVWLDPEGKLVGLNHEFESERPLPSLSQDEARLLALHFLKEKAGLEFCETLNDRTSISQLKLLPDVKLIEHGTTKQAHRVDHYFSWEDRRQEFKGAFLRSTVEVSGNQVSSFNHELHVPEEFESKFNDMRSYNLLLKSISQVLFSIVSAAMVLAFFWALSAGKIRWRLALAAGLVSFILALLDYWNDFQSLLQSYSTTDSLRGYLTSCVNSSLVTAGLEAMAAVVLIAGVEAVYRTRFKDKTAAENFLKVSALSHKKILEPIIAGICVFGMHIGYVAVFYLIGQKLDFWSPLEVRELTTISSISPAFSAFVVGVNAGISEELLYRVLCFVLAQMFFKNFWLANLVQAAGWAFMHSDYPQEPAYARGLELTVVGLFYGYIMRRYGVMAGIVAHFTYDAFLGVTMMLSPKTPWLLMQGLAAFSPPFLALAYGLIRRCQQKPDTADQEDLSNEKLLELSLQAKSEPVKVEAEGKSLEITPLSKNARLFAIVSSIIAIAISCMIVPERIGAWAQLSKSKSEIIKIAEGFLKERGIKESGWMESAVLSDNLNSEEAQYGFEKEGLKKTKAVLKQGRVPLLWWVRFYKPQQRREYTVVVSADGRPLSMQVTDAEDAEGEKPDEDQARKLTEEFLRKYRPEYLPLKFESIVQHERKNRIDYAVSYEVPSLQLGEARLQITVATVGGQVSFPHVTWDIPDSWEFERSKETVKDHVCRALAQLLMLVLLTMSIIWGFGVFRSQQIHWRPAVFVAACTFVLTLLNQFNELPFKLASYDTDVPYAGFITEIAVNSLSTAIFFAAMYALVFVIGHASFRLIFPGVSLLSLAKRVFARARSLRIESGRLWMDGMLAAYCWVFVSAAVQSLEDLASARFSPEISVHGFSSLTEFSRNQVPAIESIMSGLMLAFAYLCMAPAFLGFYYRFFGSFQKYIVFAVISVVLLDLPMRHWQDSLIQSVSGSIMMVWLFVWIKHFAGKNPLAYFLTAFLNALMSSIVSIARFAPQVFAFDLGVLCLAFLLPLLIALALKAAPSESSAT